MRFPQRTRWYGNLREQRNQLASIFLRPGTWRRRRTLRMVDSVLGLFVRSRRVQTAESVRKADVRSILVFDAGALGDKVLLAPFLRSLRRYLPNAEIVLAGRSAANPFLTEQGLVTECLVVRVPWPRLQWRSNWRFLLAWVEFARQMRSLRPRQFDLAFSCGWSSELQGNFAIWLSGAQRRVGYGYAGGAYCLTEVVDPDLARPHILDRNLRLLESIGVPVIPHQETVCVAAEDAAAAIKLFTHLGATARDLIIGIHPGAGSAIREWGDDRFAAVGRWAADQFGAKILWFSDPGKPKPLPSGLKDALPLTLPLREFTSALSGCQLFICNDSGPMHVAAGLGVPVVAVFGPQRPEWFGPYGEGHQVVIRHDVWCRPCGDRCIWGEPHCLRLISVEQVMRAVRAALERLESVRRSAEEATVRELASVSAVVKTDA